MPVSHIHPGLRPRVALSSQESASAASSSSKSSPGSKGGSNSGAGKVADRSTLVLSYALTPPAAAGAATSLIQNNASSIVAWSDVFDVAAAPCDAWWLRAACADDGSGLCVGDVDQLRTMQARLARAAQLAAGGGKWGLLQAVLLSWDSAPACAQSWVRQQIALEACGLLILPAAGQGLDADVKGAWEALLGKEQQLWCQLQQARLLHSDSDLRPASLTHYTVDRTAFAQLLQHATGVPEAGALLAQPAMSTDGDLAALNMFPTAATRRRNMDASYTALLLCCRVYGTSHPRTREALEDTRVTDPGGWVPLLLAGLAYPSCSWAPGVTKGSKEEATAYVYNHGLAWADAPSSAREPLMANYGPHLCWLLKQRGTQLPSKEQQGDLRALRYLNSGQVQLACQAVNNCINSLQDYVHLGLVQAVRELGLAPLLRGCVVAIGCALQMTYNLPPLDVAPQHWGPVAELLMIRWDGADLEELRSSLYIHVNHHHSMALSMLGMVPRMKRLIPNAEAKTVFWRASEPADMQAFLTASSSSFCRVYWQLGFVDMAQGLAQTGWEEQRALERKKPGSTPARQQGVSQPGSAPWKAIQAFRSQQQQQADQLAAADTGAGSTSNTGPHTSPRTTSSSSRASTRGASAPDSDISSLPRVTFQQDPLFQSFPGWLDQLVSQVVGRPVTLAIEVEDVVDTNSRTRYTPTAPKTYAEVYLVEADGSKVPFSWGPDPGDLPAATTTTDTTSSTTASAAVITPPTSLLAATMPGGSSNAKNNPLPRGSDMGQHMEAGNSAGSSSSHSSPTMSTAASSPCSSTTTSSSSPHTPRNVSLGGCSSSSGWPAAVSAGCDGANSSVSSTPGAARVATSISSSTSDHAKDADGGVGVQSSATITVPLAGKKEPRPCAMCGQLFTKLQRCSKCKQVLYCSREHQVAHWKAVHKMECQQLLQQ